MSILSFSKGTPSNLKYGELQKLGEGQKIYNLRGGLLYKQELQKILFLKERGLF